MQIFCEPVNVTLIHTLHFNDRFSSQILLHFVNHLNKTVVGQIYGIVYAGITLFETYRPGQVVTFQIFRSFYVFGNYSLTHRIQTVTGTKLSPSLPSICAHFRHATFNNYLTVYRDIHESIENVNS